MQTLMVTSGDPHTLHFASAISAFSVLFLFDLTCLAHLAGIAIKY